MFVNFSDKINNSLNNLHTSTLTNEYAIVDSGTTTHMLTPHAPCVNKTSCSGIPIKLPNNTFTKSSHTANMDMPFLSPEATKSHIVPAFKDYSLFSVAQLTRLGYRVIFDDRVIIMKNGIEIHDGHFDEKSGLFWIKITQNSLRTPPTINSPLKNFTANAFAQQIEKCKNKELATFYHRCLLCPVKSTFLAAIKNNQFSTWPGLTTELISKYLEPQENTAQGHMRHSFKGVKSTRNSDNYKIPNHKKSKHLYIRCIEPTGKVYSDQTENFPLTSTRGFKYILIFYDVDSNAIISRPLKSKEGKELLENISEILQLLISRGYHPTIYRLDNEVTKNTLLNLNSMGITYQLVPPRCHRRNAAERAIQSYKNHMISALCTVDPRFPMALWCRLLPTIDLTLNLLRTSNLHPQLSAQTALFGEFNYNVTPIVPLGTKSRVYDPPSKRKSWGTHCFDGWYVGPSMNHYRCHRVYILKSKQERDSDTVEFFPHNFELPIPSSTDRITMATKELTETLLQPAFPSPLPPIGD